MEDVQALTRKYIKYAEAEGKKVGVHTHNNQQLAYANTIEALILGASFLDSTLGGLGRGAGNCPTELSIRVLEKPAVSSASCFAMPSGLCSSST